VECRSVVKLTEQCRATLDPVLDRLVAVEKDRQHEVGRVTGSGQNAASLAGLVYRALVPALNNATTSSGRRHVLRRSHVVQNRSPQNKIAPLNFLQQLYCSAGCCYYFQIIIVVYYAMWQHIK